MKKLVIAAAFVGTTVAAQAADLPTKVPYTKAPPMVAQAYNWTGFYVGVNAGFGFGRDLTSASLLPLVSEQARISPFGALGGGQIGYNREFGDFGLGNVVLGVETDIQGAGLTSTRTCGIAVCDPAGGTQYSQKLDWFGTARGRIGLATGPVLSYVTGGFAYGQVQTGFQNLASGAATNFSETRTGWTIGSGVEAALGGNWTGKIEYLYLDLGTQTGLGALPGLTTSTFSSEIREQIFRLGLNYRIGGTGAYAPEPLRNWAGLYIGGNGGSATARNPSALTFPTDIPIDESRTFLNPDGIIGGAQIGYNWQAANWVFGLETDIQGSSQRDNKVCLILCNGGTTTAFDQKMSWFGTARGRLGYAVGSSLFYATGGLAYGEVKTAVNTLSGITTTNNTLSHTKTGWTVGAGLESPFEFFNLFGKNWTAKTEYLYVDLGKTSDSFASPILGALSFSTHAQEHILRSGLNYHFNSPVVTKY